MVIGRYEVMIVEGDAAVMGREEPAVRVAEPRDLASLDDLLVPNVDHEKRLSAGDLCTFIVGRDHSPVGVSWINAHTHQDRYLGSASRPPSGGAYLNQTFVVPDYRMLGFGPRLVVGSLYWAARHDLWLVRAAVSPSNVTMMRLMSWAGFKVVGRQRGVRLGSHLTVRVSRWSA